MTIRYSNGRVFEAVLLSQSEDAMRIALQGSEDVLELKHISGTWITDECEPVHVDFAWAGRSLINEISEDACCCTCCSRVKKSRRRRTRRRAVRRCCRSISTWSKPARNSVREHAPVVIL
jgi:hypothetical protein